MRFLNSFAYWFINVGWWIAVAFAIAGGVILATSTPAEPFVDWHLPIHLEMGKKKSEPAIKTQKKLGHGPNVTHVVCPNVRAEIIGHSHVWHQPVGSPKVSVKTTLLRDVTGQTHVKKFAHLGMIGEWIIILNKRCG